MPGAVFANVVVPSRGTGAPLPTSYVQVRMPTGRHETATFRFADRGMGRTLRRDAPVQIDFGRGADRATFFGYVNRVTASTPQRGTPVPIVTVTCIGATYVCASARKRAWRGTYVTIAAEVARLNRLKAVVEPSKTVFSVNQAGKTDWELLLALAALSGRVLYARGVQVCLVTRDYWLNRAKTGAPVLSLSQKAPQGDILKFTPRATSFDPANPSRELTVQGMDPRGALISATAKGATSRVGIDTSQVVKNAGAAREAADAKAEEARYAVRVDLHCTGHARVEQGKPVFLQNVAPQYAGWWLVDEVAHTVEGGRYRMDVTVVTDALKHVDDPVVPREAPDADTGGEDPPNEDIAVEVGDELAEPVDVETSDGGVLDPESPEPADLDQLERSLEDPSELSVETPPPGDVVWVALPAPVEFNEDAAAVLDALEPADESEPDAYEPPDPNVEEP